MVEALEEFYKMNSFDHQSEPGTIRKLRNWTAQSLLKTLEDLDPNYKPNGIISENDNLK